MRRLLSLAVISLWVSLPLFAQSTPTDERGFAPNRVYDFHDIDSVNLFNGNVNLRVPIGPEYRVSGLLSYRLMLTYNSHVWTYSINPVPPFPCDSCSPPPQTPWVFANPVRSFNAGLGWKLSLGRLNPPTSPEATLPGVWVFETSDGAQHSFYDSLHNEPHVAGVWYTNDGTYMRLEASDTHAASVIIREPNGTTYTFRAMTPNRNREWDFADAWDGNHPYRLWQIADALGNAVTITYGSNLPTYKEIWTITDPARTNTLYFGDGGPWFDGVLKEIDLQTFNGHIERYTFVNHPADIARPLDDNTNGVCDIAVPILDAFYPQDAAGFSFQYVLAPPPPDCPYTRDQLDPTTLREMSTQGVLTTLTLPTKGTMSWTYHALADNEMGQFSNPVRSPILEHPVVADSRTLTDRDGTAIGKWTYGRKYGAIQQCTVLCPSGNSDECRSGRSRQLTAWVTEPPPDPGTPARTTITYYSNYQFISADPPLTGDICSDSDPIRWDDSEYALPFTRYASVNSQFLSSEVRTGCVPPTVATVWNGIGMVPPSCGTIAQTKYVTYRTEGGHETDHNALQSSETTYYGLGYIGTETVNYGATTTNPWMPATLTIVQPSCDSGCRFTSVYNDSFDGAGHFRQTSSAASPNFSGGSYRTVFTNFDGLPQQGWQLGTYSEKCALDEASARAPFTDATKIATKCADLAIADPKAFRWSAYQFDKTHGLLTRERVFSLNGAGGTPTTAASVNDVLTVFNYDLVHGDRISTEWYGGDAQPLTTSDLFNAQSPGGPTLTPRYAVDERFTYSPGLTAHTAKYRGMTFFTADVMFDPGSSAPISSRDSALVETRFNYDGLVRLTDVTPQPTDARVATIAPTHYDYADATAATPASVTATRTGSAGLLTQEIYKYDGFGRLTTEGRLMPSGNMVWKTTFLNAMGWPLKIYDFGTSTDSLDYTGYSGYDGFGRAATIKAPDGTQTNIAYTPPPTVGTITGAGGVWEVTRTITDPGSASPTYETIQGLDDKGRLTSVTEHSDPTGAKVTTAYGYDVADRLISVATLGQPRSFVYDGRGFLTSETHPEKGTNGKDGTVSYGSYDARGHAGTKTEPGSATATLAYQYDGAERLTAVLLPDGSSNPPVLKQFEFAATNAPLTGGLTSYAQGKLARSTRHNYFPNSQIADYVVSQSYDYAGTAGAVSAKSTCVEDREFVEATPCAQATLGPPKAQRTFASTYAYDELGDAKDVGYPSCSSCPAGTIQPGRDMLASYTNGYLTDVISKSAAVTDLTPGNMTYAQNGMLATVPHPGPSTVDTITPDDHLMLRPKSIAFKNWTACGPPVITGQLTSSTGQGNSNVTLTITAIGDAPLTYAWWVNGVLAQSGPLSTYSTGHVTSGTQVYVVVSNSCGSVQSQTITVGVNCVLPLITNQPPEVQAMAGKDATLYVAASGQNLNYRWYRGDPPAVTSPVPCPSPNASNPSVNCSSDDSILTLKNVIENEAGDYWVDVSTNGCGSAPNPQITKVVVLNSCDPIHVVSQPAPLYDYSYVVPTADKSNKIPITLAVGVTGTDPVAAWRMKIDEPGKTFDTDPCVDANLLPCTGIAISVAPNETTYYNGEVWSGCDSNAQKQPITQTEVRVIACDAIVVGVTPADQRVVEGTTATLPLNATLASHWIKAGTDSLIATWYQGATGDVSTPLATLSGSPNVSFTTQPLVVDTQFWCRLSAYSQKGPPSPSNLMCAIDTPTVTVTVCHKPRIIGQPQDLILEPSQPAFLTVSATGDKLTYQWYSGSTGDTSKPTPSTSAAINVTATTTTPATYWVRINGECGTVDSRTVSVYLCIPPAITSQPQDTIVIVGNVLELSVGVDPNAVKSCHTIVSPGVHYQWYQGTTLADSVLVGSDSPTLTMPNLAGGATYTFWVTVEACGCSTESRRAQVYVCIPPTIQQQPKDAETISGQAATLTFVADQPDAVGHWYQVASDGSTSTFIGDGSSLNVAPITTTSYFVRVDNGSCSTDSRVATVYACTPYIVAQPQSTNIVRGDTVQLMVDAYGTQPLTYQWYRGTSGDRTNPVPNSNTDLLEDTPLVDTSYWVEITSPCALKAPAAQSATAIVTVCQPPIVVSSPGSVVVPLGSATTLTVSATGTNIRYQWYVGQPGDTTHPILNVDLASISVIPAQTTSYWVRVTGDCGSADSAVAVVTVCIPPTLTGPNDALIVIGQTPTATLTVSADETIASVSWYQGSTGDTSVPVGTGVSLTTPALTQTTTYWARVSNGQCTTDSRTATVAVCTPPSIVQPPVSTTTTSGQFVVLSVNASGDGTLTYAWYQGKSGDTTTLLAGPDFITSLGVAPLTTTDYWVRVSNGTCSADSATATVSVCTPAITKQPVNATMTEGQSTSLTVAATGTAPLTVQWYAGQPGDTSHPLSGATNFTQSFSPSSTTTYWARVATSCGFANSAAATITVNPLCSGPVITATSQSAYLNGAVLSVTATGTALQYQWFASDPAGSAWTAIPNATSNAVTVLPTGSVAYYYVRVSNACGTANSTSFIVNNTSCSLAITSDPTSQSYAAGTPVTLSVGATGNSLSFQWYGSDPDGSAYTPIAGATANTLTILPSSPVASYYAVVTNGCGEMAQSAAATLTLVVCNAPAITQQPSSVSITSGTTTTLTVSALGDAPLAFQWYSSSTGSSWTAIPNGNSASLSVTPTATSYYYVHVSNGCGSADSNYATVTVIPSGCTPPTIQTEPTASISMQQAAPVTLTVVASGTSLTYQWYQSTSSTSGWTAVPNATNASMTLTAQYSPAYFYVQIKGTCGSLNSTISTVRTLWLECPPPAINTPSGNIITFNPGSSVTMTVSASGSDLRYVWLVSDPAGVSYTVGQNGPSDTFTYTPVSQQVFISIRVYDDLCGAYVDGGIMWTLYASNYCPVPNITTQPQGATITAGQSVTLAVAVSQACQGQVTYQWYEADPGLFDWAPIAGATLPSITVSPTQSQWYYVKVTNTADTSVSSNTAAVTVQ